MGVEREIASLASATGGEAVDISGGDYVPSQAIRGFVLGVSGDVKVDYVDGSTVTLPALAAGVTHGHKVKKIYKTGTTATTIVALR